MVKAIPNKHDVNQDVVESIQSVTELEDELHSQLDQLDALCAAQLALATEGCRLTPADYRSYCQILKGYSQRLKRLVERLYG